MKNKQPIIIISIVFITAITACMFLMNKGYETVIVNKPGYKECSSRSIEIQRVECMIQQPLFITWQWVFPTIGYDSIARHTL